VCLVTLLSLPGVSSAAEEREARRAEKDSDSSDRFARELSKRIQGKAPLEDVRVDVRWPVVDHYASIRLYGRGLLICDAKSQLTVPRDAVLSTLKSLRDGRFSAMEDYYGSAGEEEEREREERKPEERKPEEGPALKGFVEVRLGSAAKRVQQFAVGDQSTELEALARQLLTVCRNAKETPITASSLDDGLRKLTAGTLAPETLGLVLHRRADAKAGDGGESFILEVQGRRVTDRPMPAGQTPPAPRAMLLPPADFTSLVRLLADQGLGEIPINVYADRYTDLRVTVLDRERSILARRFLNTTAKTHGEKQQAFDRVYEALHALHARVAKEGRTIGSETASGGKDRAKQREREKEREKE
jgi:hypothetical protein